MSASDPRLNPKCELTESQIETLILARMSSLVLHETAVLDADQPSNVFPLAMFSSTVKPPAAGEYLARVSFMLNSDNGLASGGSFLSNGVVVRFRVNGAVTGHLALVFLNAGDPSPYESVVFEQPLDLEVGDTVDVAFGFLAAGKTTDLHILGGRVLSLTPRIDAS
jgi:hypothetical protein